MYYIYCIVRNYRRAVGECEGLGGRLLVYQKWHKQTDEHKLHAKKSKGTQVTRLIAHPRITNYPKGICNMAPAAVLFSISLKHVLEVYCEPPAVFFWLILKEYNHD